MRTPLFAIFLLWTLRSGAADAYPTALRAGLPGNLFTNAGVNLGAGVPERPTVFASTNNNVTAAGLNALITACPSNQAVLLAAGTYDFEDTRIQILGDGKTVRGSTNAAGWWTTFFVNCDLRIGSDLGPAEDWGGDVTAINVTNGLTEGSTQFELLSNPGADFVVGDMFFVDQSDDGTLVKDSSTTFGHRPDRAYIQMLRLTSKSGNTITFQPPLLGRYWNTARDPEVCGFSALVGGTADGSGFENIGFDQGSMPGLYGIVFGRSANGYLRNCGVTGWATSGGAAGVRLMFDTGTTITECAIHDGPTASSSSYGIYPSPSSYFHIYNNYFTNVGLGIPLISAVGGVIAYNAGLPPYPYSPDSFLAEYFFPHGGHSHHTLYEGNWLGAPLYVDAIFGGNNSALGIIGNRIQGFGINETGNLIPITFEADMDDMVVLGNVLGIPTVQDIYPDDIVDSAVSVSGLILTNNYNTVSNAIPTGERLGSNTQRASYTYESKPAWFGVLAFPPFVSASGSSYTNTFSYTNLPAGYRAVNGEWPPAEAQGGGGSSSAIAAGRMNIGGRVNF